MANIKFQSPHSVVGALYLLLRIPNLIALDAPVVAVAWLRLLSMTFLTQTSKALPAQTDKPFLLPSMVILFATVWLIYMADRLLDCRRLDFNRKVALRHRFVNRYSQSLWPLWGFVMVVAAVAAWLYLDTKTLAAGAVLMELVLFYGWIVHGSPTLQRSLPKELIVGVLFAVGVCLPVAVEEITASLVATTALLGALFTVNCMCVARAQRASDRQQNVGSAILLFPKLEARLSWLAIPFLIVLYGLFPMDLIPAPVVTAMSISIFGLAAISWLLPRRFGQVADYALLSPLVVMAVLR